MADNEYLRDSLRASEDSRKPENKVAFFIAVYQHLRERIRQDIIKTDDPIDAIEQMEIELSRLTNELTGREKNWRSVRKVWQIFYVKPFSVNNNAFCN